MSITSLISSLIFSIKEIVIAFLLLLLLSPNSYSLNPKHETLDSTKDVLVEEKSRLGSMPPSCYNKCNQCHPCMAVQVSEVPKIYQLMSIDLYKDLNWDVFFFNFYFKLLLYFSFIHILTPLVQVPSLSSHKEVGLSGDVTRTQSRSMDYNTLESNRYSNYKPLGWKCRCGGHFYNP
ncbi:EPIDERMAL PATTERNING FACTOR-like protein 1 [Lycium barbarum]|uniref:EPIDERMAL PATTERNING FACTOR-like protein 1 n=1 Tax=Lycium barbarum TaxID=112863 RepID=UPI00293E0362|nr:EPIDERMAL PATTERNING FACTOR-like protein 1 [Lycium barbarum]